MWGVGLCTLRACTSDNDCNLYISVIIMYLIPSFTAPLLRNCSSGTNSASDCFGRDRPYLIRRSGPGRLNSTPLPLPPPPPVPAPPPYSINHKIIGLKISNTLSLYSISSEWISHHSLAVAPFFFASLLLFFFFLHSHPNTLLLFSPRGIFKVQRKGGERREISL